MTSSDTIQYEFTVLQLHHNTLNSTQLQITN